MAFKVLVSAARQFIGPLIELSDSLDKGHNVVDSLIKALIQR